MVAQTELYQLIQYSPSTDEVFKTPLVIFPPWINRFYILDLTPKKSFIKWAVDQGITVFVVSWKSADESMQNVVWDDYIRAQIGAIECRAQPRPVMGRVGIARIVDCPNTGSANDIGQFASGPAKQGADQADIVAQQATVGHGGQSANARAA